MRKRWYIFIILVLSVFLIVLAQPLTYSLDNSCPDNLELVKLGDQPVFCVSDKGRAEIIGKRLEKIAENGSFKTDDFILNSQNKTLGIPYILITRNERDKVAVVENNSLKLKDFPEFDTGGSNSKIQQNNELTNIIELAIKNHTKKRQESNYLYGLGIGLEVTGILLLLGFYYFWLNQKDLFIQNQEWSIFWLFIFLLIAAVGVFLLFSKDKFLESLGLILPIFLGLIGGFYASLKSIESTRVTKAFEYFDKWDSEELQKRRITLLREVRGIQDRIEELRGQSLSEQDIVEARTLMNRIKDINQEELNISVRVVSNFWEKVYFLLQNGLADKKILKDAFKELYQREFSEVCQFGLNVLDNTLYLNENQKRLTENAPSNMSQHLHQLGEDEIWQ
jgi:hypothetical protein